nr:sodium-coupled monocarboxylate transporter 1 [Parasteatoda tepidariorum]
MESEDTQSHRKFDLPDYGVCIAMLGVSAGIGVFYAISGRKQNTTKEFLFGGKTMNVIPVGLSVLATFLSAITLLGLPAESYQFGIQYWLINISYCFMLPIVAHIYVPLFYKLQVSSVNEYLEKRYNKFIRTVCFVISTISQLLYIAFVIYAPSLVLSQVTGLHLWVCVSSIGIVCTFYTTIGGIKAVIWTDVFQIIIIFGALITIIVKGAIDVGGIDVVWSKAEAGGRTAILDFNPDPTVRHTFWSLTFGGFFTWLSIYAVNQAMVQRSLTIPTLPKAKAVIWMNLPGNILSVTLTLLVGLIIYVNYSTCDPIKTKQVSSPNQIFPLFVMDSLRDYPGLPGLFVSGIFSGALRYPEESVLRAASPGSNNSSYSPGHRVEQRLDSMDGYSIPCSFIIMPQFIDRRRINLHNLASYKNSCKLRYSIDLLIYKPNRNLNVNSIFQIRIFQQSRHLEILIYNPRHFEVRIYIYLFSALFYGIVAIVLVVVVENMTGTVLQAALSISGALGGPILGIYTLGMFFPWPSAFAAFIGLISGLGICIWICIGSIMFRAPNPTAVLSVESCEDLYMSVTQVMSSISNSSTPVFLPREEFLTMYRLSYLWYSGIGCLVVIIIGLLVSLAKGNNKQDVEKSLMTPFFYNLWGCDPKHNQAEREIQSSVPLVGIQDLKRKNSAMFNKRMSGDFDSSLVVQGVYRQNVGNC